MFLVVPVAITTDNGKVVECNERVGQFALGQKQLLAFLAPRLKIFGIRAVFNEANRIDRVDHVTADNGSDLLAVLTAFDVGRFLLGHNQVSSERRGGRQRERGHGERFFHFRIARSAARRLPSSRWWGERAWVGCERLERPHTACGIA